MPSDRSHGSCCFDPRGAGLSDPLTVDRLPTLETRVADALTVMEAAGSERPALFGMDATGPLAIFFAATYPDRTAALVLFGTFACGLKDEEYPWAWSVEEWDAHDREVEERWGQPDFVESFVRCLGPTARLDRESIALWANYYRQAASPGMAVALNQLERETDVRSRPPHGAGPDARPASEGRGRLSRRGGPLHGSPHPGGAVSSSSRARTTSPGTATWRR